MREIKAGFPEAKRYELFTEHLSESNFQLYRRLGYAGFVQKLGSDARSGS